VRTAITLKEPARLTQHLFYFIAHETGAAIKQRDIYFIAAFVLFDLIL